MPLGITFAMATPIGPVVEGLPEWLFRLIFWWSSTISWTVIEILPVVPVFLLFCLSVEGPLWAVPLNAGVFLP